ncbi:MAG: glycosyltransferase family 2 protein [Planctomycetota bacterium]|nr:glycosyltransferase family 2 protein [Planctomycetota bacterium]
MAQTLTVLVPVYNEEDDIRKCLESVKWADDIFIVDSFSTDRTLEIAAEYTDNIVSHEYVNSATQKNWAIPQCKGDWIMVLDADEFLSELLQKKIRKILASGDVPFDGYYIKRETYFFGRLMKHCGWQREYITRLWRNGKGRYEDKHVHAGLIIDGEVGKLHEPIYHDTYKDFDDYFEKFERYTTWSAKDLQDRGKKASLFTLAFRPLWRFFKMYILNLGFLDGKHGFILSTMSSFYVLTKYAKLWNIKQVIKDDNNRS